MMPEEDPNFRALRAFHKEKAELRSHDVMADYQRIRVKQKLKPEMSSKIEMKQSVS